MSDWVQAKLMPNDVCIDELSFSTDESKKTSYSMWNATK